MVKSILEGKYFHISNCVFTMKGWTVKKIILRCFFKIGLFCLHTKFQVSQSSPSGFLSKNAIFVIIFAEKIFFLENIYGFTAAKKRIIRFGPKMSKSWAITFKDSAVALAG